MTPFQSIVTEIEAAESMLAEQINLLGQLKKAARVLAGLEPPAVFTIPPHVQARIDVATAPVTSPMYRGGSKRSPLTKKVEAWALTYFGKTPKTFPRAEIAKKIGVNEKTMTVALKRLVKAKKLVWNGKRNGSAYALGVRSNGSLH